MKPVLRIALQWPGEDLYQLLDSSNTQFLNNLQRAFSYSNIMIFSAHQAVSSLLVYKPHASIPENGTGSAVAVTSLAETVSF
jgi:hypothetical protein